MNVHSFLTYFYQFSLYNIAFYKVIIIIIYSLVRGKDGERLIIC